MTVKIPPEEEWLLILDQEEAENTAAQLVDEIMQRTQSVIFDKSIKQRLLPYTVEAIRDDLWKYYRKDSGKMPVTTLDSEPEPVPIDSWARGVVPFRKPITPPVQANGRQGLPQQYVMGIEDCSDDPSPIIPDIKIVSGSSDTVLGASGERLPTLKVVPMMLGGGVNLGDRRMSRSMSNIHSGEERRLSRASITGFPSEERRMSKLSLGMFPGTRRSSRIRAPPSLKKAFTVDPGSDVPIVEDNQRVLGRMNATEKDVQYTYDHEGRIVLVKKQQADKSTATGVKTMVPVLPDIVPPAQSALKRVVKDDARTVRAGGDKAKKMALAKKLAPILSASKQALNQDDAATDPALTLPSVIDNIQLQPGVVIREGEQSKEGPPPLRKMASVDLTLSAANLLAQPGKRASMGQLDSEAAMAMSQVFSKSKTVTIKSLSKVPLPDLKRVSTHAINEDDERVGAASPDLGVQQTNAERPPMAV